MAVVFDAVGPSSAGTAINASSSSWSHTCTGSNRLLTVSVSIGLSDDSNSAVAVTYNGVAMTAASTPVHSGNVTAGYVQMFYLVAPATGSNTVQVSHTISGSAAAADIISGSVSFTGVDQTTPVTNVATATGTLVSSGSVSVTSATGNMVVDAFCCGSGFASGGSTQTNRWLNNFNSNTGAGSGAQSTAAGAASVSMGYTFNNDDFGLIGANLVAAPTTPVVTTEAVTNITPATATGNGTVVSDGGNTITERGVCWSTSVNPTTSDSKASTSGTTGSFSVSITGLSDLTQYHARAYAVNTNGTSYGGDVAFINIGTTLGWLSA